ncbi:MAG: adenosine deaminase [Spirochaetes bacterium]|nr:adenosine deaminase [Spirochaetota bacterium]
MLEKKVIKNIPKIELHRHLEGSFRIETLLEMAKKRKLNSLPLDNLDTFRQINQMTNNDPKDFLTFLSKFRADWYSTLEDPKRLAFESVEDIAKENVIYYEMRFSPEHFMRETGFSAEAVIEAVIEGSKKAGEKFNVDVAFIVTMSRDKLNPDQMSKLIKKCSKYHDNGILGVDLAGDEIHYPPELFKSTFQGLYEKTGLRATIHAGEAAGPESVEIAVDQLEAKRIGHGIRSVEDKKLMDKLVEKNVTLELCLSSNLLTGTIKSIDKHPFPIFYKKGLNITLNSDDPQVQQKNLIDDYTLAAQTFSFSLEDFKKFNLNSINAAFASRNLKDKLIDKLNNNFPTLS